MSEPCLSEQCLSEQCLSEQWPHALGEGMSWVRQLAYRLVSDRALADDLVQETMLVAIQRPPLHSRAVRAWLARVLHNRLWLHRRGESRRTRREHRSVSSETVLSDTEYLERVEVVEHIGAAVRNLPAPYRRVILLRYFDDLSPVAIAEQLGVPASTIRTRLARAHDQLRQRLDDEYGNRRRWSLILTPFVGRSGVASSAAAIASLTTGSWLIGMKKFASTAAILLLLFTGFLAGDRLGWWDDNSASVDEKSSGEALLLPSVAVTETAAPPALFEDNRSGAETQTTRADEAEHSPDSSSEPVSAEGEVAVVSGHVYRTDGASLEGARVFLWGGEQPGSLVDAEGLFRIESLEEMGSSIYLEHHETQTALDSQVRPLLGEEVVLEIEVVVGNSITLETVDRLTQRPIPNVEIVIHKAVAIGQAGVIFAITDARGRVVCDYLHDGDYTVEVNHPDYTQSDVAFRTPRAGSIVCQLDPARRLEVTLAGYSEYPPQESVTLDLWQEGGASMNVAQTPNEDGTFSINAPPVGRWRGVLSGSPEFPYVRINFDVPAGEGSVQLPLKLPVRGQTTVVGRLLDTIGDPIPDAGRLAIGKFYSPVQADGSFELQHVTGGEHEVRLLVGGGDNFSERHLAWITIPDSGDVHRDFAIEGRGRLVVSLRGLPADQLAGSFGAGIRSLDDPSVRSLASKIGPAHKDVEFDRLSLGRYRVSPSLVFADVRGRASYAWGGSLPSYEIEIRSDTDVSELIVEIPEPARLEFMIDVPSGSSIPGVASIQLRGENQEWMRFPFVEIADRTAELGFYVSGSFQVTIDLDGYEAMTESVTLRAGDTTRRTLKPTALP